MAGDSHQGHQQFSDISTVRQCSLKDFLFFFLFLFFQGYCVHSHFQCKLSWYTATVDRIEIKGDRTYILYLNAFESHIIQTQRRYSWIIC